MLTLLVALACAAEPAPAPAGPPDPAAADAAPPPGRIGGDPILDWPVVLGALSTEAVQAALAGQQAAIDACLGAAGAADPGLRGKVLVRFQVDARGRVGEARVRATSLRHAATEDCLLEVVRATPFPVLPAGQVALVDYPFRLGSP